MAITGISALSGQQIIASGACSARSAATASYTTGGNDIQGLYTTVNSNSGNWNTPIFPRDITADSLFINNNGDITLLQQTGDDSDDYAQTVIHGSGIEFINGQIDPTVIGTIAGNDVSNWNSTYNTVSTNSGSWTGGGGGIEYSGIAPIAVNNVSHEISADMSNYVLVSSNDTQSLRSTKLSYSRIDLWAYIYSGNKNLYEPFRYYEYRTAGSPAQKGEFTFLIDDKANLTISASATKEPYIRIGSYSGGSYGYNDVNRAAIQKWNNAVNTVSSNSANWNSTYDTVSANSASWAGGGGGGDYVETSAVNVIIGNSNYTSQATGTVLIQGVQNTASDYSLAQGYNNSTLYTSFCQGYYNSTNDKSLAQGLFNTAQNNSIAQGNNNYAVAQCFAQGINNSAATNSFAQGCYNTASGRSFVQGYALSAINSAVAFGSYNLHCDGSIVSGNSAAFVIGDGQNSMSRHDLMLVTKDGEITMYGSTADTVGTGIMSSIRTVSASCNDVIGTVSSNSGTWNAKQNALTDVSDIVVTASLPVSPVSSTLYLIPEA